MRRGCGEEHVVGSVGAREQHRQRQQQRQARLPAAPARTPLLAGRARHPGRTRAVCAHCARDSTLGNRRDRLSPMLRIRSDRNAPRLLRQERASSRKVGELVSSRQRESRRERAHAAPHQDHLFQTIVDS